MLIHLWLMALATVINCAQIKYKNETQPVKPAQDKAKKVSSDKVHNGGRKGPLSGGSPQGLPMPLTIPFPIIPHQGSNQSQQQTSSKKKKNKQKTKKNNRKESESGKVFLSSKSSSKTVSEKNKLRSRKSKKTGERKTRDINKDFDSNIVTWKDLKDVIDRRKRQVDGDNYDKNLDKDESALLDNWISPDYTGKLPGSEAATLIHDDLKFIVAGHSHLLHAVNDLIPDLKTPNKRSIKESVKKSTASNVNSKRRHKRSIDDDDDEDDTDENEEDEDMGSVSKRYVNDEIDDSLPVSDMLLNHPSTEERYPRSTILGDELNDDIDDAIYDILNGYGDDDNEIHNMYTRDVNEDSLTIEEAQKQIEVADKAAAALTTLELKIGIDPQNLVSNTHSYVESLQAEKQRVDADMRRDIIAVSSNRQSNTQKKSQVQRDSNAARRQLQHDKLKIQEINTELKQLKDIELMATGLEVAKYLAKEKARHNLELAQARSNIGKQVTVAPLPPPPPQPAPVMTPAYPSYQMNQMSPSMFQTSPPSSVNTFYQWPTSLGPQVMPNQPAIQTFFNPQSQNVQPFFNQQHVSAEQRHQTKPVVNTLYQQPMNQYFSNYLQEKAVQGNLFTRPQYSVAPSLVNFFKANGQVNPSTYKQTLAVAPDLHMRAQQKHIQPVSKAPSLFTNMNFQNFQSTTLPNQYTASFARPSKENKVGAPDHENSKIEQSHKTPNDQHDESPSHDDWFGALSFPGDTYSPPPAWNHSPKESEMRAQTSNVVQYNSLYGNQQQNNPLVTRPAIPFSPTAMKQPMAPQQIPSVAQVESALPYPYTSQQQSSLQKPVIASYANTFPMNSPPPVGFIKSETWSPPAVLHKEIIGTKVEPIAITYTLNHSEQPPQQSVQQQASVGEVLKVDPQAEHVVVNHQPPAPSPPPPPPDMSGNLPGYWGAVDFSKYDLDIADRIRQKNKTDNDQNTNQNSNINNDRHNKIVHDDDDSPTNVKRQFQKVKEAEIKLNDVNKAANAVTHIENAIGFDPGSIEKMVDFVKKAAIKDVKLSKEALEQDKQTLKKIQNKNKKKSSITKTTIDDNLALTLAQSKLQTDEAVLADAEDRLDKIKKMEMIVTEVEVAKYISQNSATTSLVGEKRTLDNLKRQEIAKP